MKILQTIGILIFLNLSVNSQEIQRINTKDLISVSNKFGLDSALHLSGGFPIYRIDSITALDLLDKMITYTRYSPSEYFFNEMAHNWTNEKVKFKTQNLALLQLNEIKSKKRDKYNKLIVLDDKLIISIIKQEIQIEQQLISCYNFCDSLSDCQKKEFPNFFQRIPNAFTGETPLIIKDYKASQENCYKIMRLLGELKSDYFDPKKYKYHKSKLRPYERDRDIFRFEEHYREYDSALVNLNGNYNSINELDFSKEPKLQKIIKGFNEDKCWKFILQNDRRGFLDLGCLFAPLSGFGVQYKIELIDRNKLLIVIIDEWIS
ncbi:hypothetical protein SDC9_104505 [bioreactor metagenome]|uniref:Uncharacterized protein n=2 Tax=root TaxID=1 RepID=A0A645AWR7_9ZZZZ